jgi:hypothetical protein
MKNWLEQRPFIEHFPAKIDIWQLKWWNAYIAARHNQYRGCPQEQGAGQFGSEWYIRFLHQEGIIQIHQKSELIAVSVRMNIN